MSLLLNFVIIVHLAPTSCLGVVIKAIRIGTAPPQMKHLQSVPFPTHSKHRFFDLFQGKAVPCFNPATNSTFGEVKCYTKEEVNQDFAVLGRAKRNY